MTMPEDRDDLQEVLEDVTEELADDTALLSQALGGWRGMVDSGAPSIAFLLTYLASETDGKHDLRLSINVALVTGAILAIERLIRRKSLQQVLSGAVGLGVSAYITSKSGHAQNFFLPGFAAFDGFVHHGGNGV